MKNSNSNPKTQNKGTRKEKIKLGKRAQFNQKQQRKFFAAMRRLEREFPTDASCIDKIYQMVIKKKSCKRCHGKQFNHQSGSRKAYCKGCDEGMSFTAGDTIFSHMKKVRPFFSMVMLTLRGVPFNPYQIHKYLKTKSYSPNWKAHRRIMGAALEELKKKSKKVSSFLFNAVIQRRSVETAARQHPTTEQVSELRSQFKKKGKHWFEKKIMEFWGETDLDAEHAREIADYRKVYDLLADGPLSLEQIIEKSDLPVATPLIAVNILLVCNLLRKTNNGLYEHNDTATDALDLQDTTLIVKVSGAIEFIDFLFQGVSRRYIQLYTASYWCFSEHSRKKRANLLNQFCTNKYNVANIENYVSPLLIDVA